MRSGRLGLSAIDKREIWSRWKAGQTLHEIGRAYGKCHNTIRAVLKGCLAAGIPPLGPSPLATSSHFQQREDIFARVGLRFCSIREIAGGLHRAASTVSRGNRAPRWPTSLSAPYAADQQAWNASVAAETLPACREQRELRDVVASKTDAGLVTRADCRVAEDSVSLPDDEGMRVSHETIYRSLFIQARGALKKELMDYLRLSKRRMRRSRHSERTWDTPEGRSSMRFPSANDLREAEDRAIPGHWEGDLLAGGKNSYIATLVERHSRFLMLVKVPSKETEPVVAALK